MKKILGTIKKGFMAMLRGFKGACIAVSQSPFIKAFFDFIFLALGYGIVHMIFEGVTPSWDEVLQALVLYVALSVLTLYYRVKRIVKKFEKIGKHIDVEVTGEQVAVSADDKCSAGCSCKHGDKPEEK